MNWIEASAGSGKTTRLIQSVLECLESGRAELSQIVAITFTEKAAGDLKLRLRIELEKRRHLAPIEQAILQLDEARFQTIHSFCQELLQENPVEACVDPIFTVLGANQARSDFRRALDDWFGAALRHPGPGLSRLLRRRFQSHDYRGRRAGVRAQLEKWAWTLAEHRDQRLDWPQPPSHWREQMDELWREFEALPPVKGSKSVSAAARAVAGWARARSSQPPEGQEALLAQSWGAVKRLPAAGPRAHAFVRDLDSWKERLGGWMAHANGDLLFHLVGEMAPVLDAYRERKQARGQLDFLDLLLRAEEWLREHSPRRPIAYLLVDECQDIDPVQARILEHLCRPSECQLTMVGDPKQAIYRFRRGDLAGYLHKRPAQVEHIHHNYRSQPALVDYFNTAFGPCFQSDDYSLQCDYSPMTAARPNEGAQLVALTLENFDEEKALSGSQALDLLIPQVCAWIQQAGRPLGDICLIFKNLSSNAPAYLEAFDQCGIDHVVLTPRGFHQREEVAALRSVLEAVEWPDDRLSVYAALRGPLFGLREPDLYEYFQTNGHFDPLQSEAADHPIAEVLCRFRHWHEQRNQRSLAQTLEELLEWTQFAVTLAHRPQGSQRVHHVRRFQQLCCQLEAEGATSFRALVEQLLNLAEEGDDSDSMSVEEDHDGVRLITAHSAKGLEFPVVILADPSTPRCYSVQQASDPDSGRFMACLGDLEPWGFGALAERERAILEAESLRLAYVAATRARDVLVVPHLDPASARESWLKPLQTGLEKAHRFSAPQGPEPLPLTPDWGPYQPRGQGRDAAASRAWQTDLQSLRSQAASGLQVTAAASYPHQGAVEVQVLFAGPHSRSIGREIHQALANLSWDAQPEDPRLRTVVQSPLWQRAAASPEAHREVPLSCPLGGGGWLEGVADLVFREEDRWVVVDFKTDGDRPEYRCQLSAYAVVLEQLFGGKVQAILAQV